MAFRCSERSHAGYLATVDVLGRLYVMLLKVIAKVAKGLSLVDPLWRQCRATAPAINLEHERCSDRDVVSRGACRFLDRCR